ncbi:MAG: hypothetical protein AB7G28_03315 [Pirellulales bacterium]
MSDITSVNEQIAALTQRLANVNESANAYATAGHVFAAAIALFTAAVFFTSYLGASKTRQVKKISDELATAREAQLSLILADKDAKIGAANATAATANAEAAKANEGLAKAGLDIEDRKNENLKLESQVTTLRTAAAKADAALEETRIKAAEALEGLAETGEWQRIQEMIRSEIEEELTPRGVNIELASANILKEFRGTKFFVTTPTEVEPIRLGKGIEDLLLESGWERVAPLSAIVESEEFEFDNNVTFKSNFRSEEELKPAVYALAIVLQKERIDCFHFIDTSPKRGQPPIPKGAISIVVGPKRTTYSRQLTDRADSPRWDARQKAMVELEGRRETKAPPDASLLGPMSENAWRVFAECAPTSGDAVLVGNSMNDPADEWVVGVRDGLLVAGWTVVSTVLFDEQRMLGIERNAVILRKNAPAARRQQAEKLHKALSDAGFQPVFVETESPPKGFAVCVLIGGPGDGAQGDTGPAKPE